MKLLTIAIASLMWVGGLTVSAQQNRSAYYHTWLYLKSKEQPIETILYETEDSSLLFLVGYPPTYPTPQVFAHSVSDIESIAFRRPSSKMVGIFYGSLAGVTVGGLMAKMTKGPEIPDCSNDLDCLVQPFEYGPATLGAGLQDLGLIVISTAVGGYIGGLIGGKKRQFHLNRSFQNYQSSRSELRGYAFRKR